MIACDNEQCKIIWFHTRMEKTSQENGFAQSVLKTKEKDQNEFVVYG